MIEGAKDMIYFTSDLHLGHPAIIQMQRRPFENVEEMNRTIINNYNSVVHKDDTVYILGDICHRLRVEEANDLISQLKGKKILLSGNHDKRYDKRLFEEVYDFKTVSLNGKVFVLMHYPMLSWPRLHHGSIQLHGHIHAGTDYNIQNRMDGIQRYDVGVDANDFRPVSVEQIIRFFEDNK